MERNRFSSLMRHVETLTLPIKAHSSSWTRILPGKVETGVRITHGLKRKSVRSTRTHTNDKQSV